MVGKGNLAVFESSNISKIRVATIGVGTVLKLGGLNIFLIKQNTY